MLSVDQVLRLISVPAIVVAFLIVSQISGAGIFGPAQARLSSEAHISSQARISDQAQMPSQ
jgi:hypothetical protein